MVGNPANGDGFVDRRVCDERFERLVSMAEINSAKTDEIMSGMKALELSFTEFKTEFKTSRQPILARLTALEEDKKKADEKELDELRTEKKHGPERRKIDRRAVFVIATTLLFSIWGSVIGTINMMKAPAPSVQTSKTTLEPSPSLAP